MVPSALIITPHIGVNIYAHSREGGRVSCTVSCLCVCVRARVCVYTCVYVAAVVNHSESDGPLASFFLNF